MTDSVNIKVAANRLQDALGKLEGALDPLLTRINALEKAAAESGDFETDRASLAQKLDTALANEAEFKDREAEFTELAEETTRELDRVIKQVKHALGQEGE